MGESIMLQDGTTIMSPMLGANGIHIIGEFPAGTELPVLGMPNGQMTSNLQTLNAGAGFFPGSTISLAMAMHGQPTMNYQAAGNNYL